MTFRYQTPTPSFRGSFATWAALLAYPNPVVGDTAYVSSLGSDGTMMNYNGSRWLPVGGQILYQLTGSVASPLSTLTGTTDATFILPGGDIQIPANLLRVNSTIRAEAIINKTTAFATSIIGVRLGTGLPLTNPGVTAWTTGSSAQQYRPGSLAMVASATRFVRTLSAGGTSNPPSPSNVGNQAQDATTNFDIALINMLSFVVTAAIASDSFSLVGYHVTLTP